ncbi:PKD domain-containing protein [Methanosarcina vacuolata]|uniref:Cell surface protein n=1 Tax=Methanosarcina vacuolata Z-761 TaxID=1434123 RepID=A0A0E3LGS0_9EURY|nr:PKD domain-containing protein [Methanosarcina vacuolata]AKB43006.1 cell surface protein [Methanosarcina vacuolata Z-761]
MSASVTHAETYHFVAKWGSEGSSDGQFSSPCGVVIGPSGNVYVADTSNHRIQEFDSSGSFINKWGSYGSSSNGPFSSPQGVAVDSSGNVYVADTYNHRIVKFDSSGKCLTKWGSEGSGEGQFYYPQGIAVDSSGNVYVADTSNNRIQEFDSNGKYITQLGSEGTGYGELDDPRGVAVDSSGNIYVADTYNNRIQKFDSNGEFLASWGSGGSGNKQFSSPSGVAVDSSGNIYIADLYNNRIQKLDSNGIYLTQWGIYGSDDGQFYNPVGVFVDSSGNISVADTYNHRIQKFDSSGTFLTKWGSEGSDEGEFESPQSVAVDSSGNFYVADTNNNRIQKFDSSGTFLLQWNTSGNDGDFSSPQGVAVDSSGNVYVADTSNHRIQKFDSSGTFLTKWGSEGNGEGEFESPQGIAVDSSGNVYVADTYNSRIQKFDSSGTFITSWGEWGGGHGQFCEPTGVAVDSAGNVYVADGWYSCRVQKFNSIGKYIIQFGGYGSDDGQFIDPHGIVVDSSGNIYVADTNNNRIQKFDSSGAFLTKWGYSGSDEGQFSNPQDIAVDSSGNVYVSDTSNNRIQKFAASLLPLANFGSNVTSGYAPLSVQFTDKSENATGWDWNFGDGTNSTEQNPVHTFSVAENYTVNLTVSNAYGTDSKLATIRVDSPSYYSVNGHYYSAIYAPEGITWTDAKTAAESSTYLGMNGHLATITSQDENDFIYNNLVVTPNYYWLGAFHPDDSPEPDSGWQWVTGEPWNYTYWDSGQPDGDYEGALQFFYNDKWNDLSRYSGESGYVIEYEPSNKTPVLPVANFSANVSEGYAPLSVQFIDLSENATSWLWDFGDGTNATEQNVSHTYTSVGNYTVNLTVSNADGNDSEVKTDYIVVSEPLPGAPVANFTATPTSGNAPLSVNFTDASTGTVSSYAWDFDNDGTVDSTKQNPVYTYAASGNYTVNLTVSNAGGSDSEVKTDYIVVSEPLPGVPVANFTATPTSGDAPLTVSFTDASTGTVSSYAWDFDNDGTVDSTDQNPVYTYAASGNYTVNLTVSNAGGSDSEVKTDYIVVSEPLPGVPVANFTATPTSGDAPLSVNFTDASTGTVSSYAWDFDNDGTVDSTKQNPVYTYATAGNYTVNLTVSNAGGSDSEVKTDYIVVSEPLPGAPVANFTATPTSGNAPLSVNFTDASTGTVSSYAWDFDNDGTVDSTKQNPVYTYATAGNYTVNLTVSNAGGSDSEVKTDYIVVSEPLPGVPVANFTATPTSGDAPLSVNFTDASTGTVSSYAWDFDNDGTVDSTDQNPVYTYAASGNYTVNLTVSNADGSDSEVKTDYIVVSEPLPGAPVANFTATPTSGDAPLSVNFTDASTGTVSSYAWDFDNDGTVDSTDQNPIYTYTASGNYTVNLTVTGPGGSDSEVKTGYIDVSSPSPSKPVANFSASPTSGKAPLNVKFTDTSTGTPTSWYWTFGDGSKSYLQNPTHKYSKAGIYTVNLTVKNAAGRNTVTKTDYIKVVTKPVAEFSASPTSGKAPLKVAFTDTSTGFPTSWKWNFGDGSTSTQQNPTHKYSIAGNYTVALTVRNAVGSNTVTKDGYIQVIEKPVANFSASPTSGKVPLKVAFTDTSTGSPTSWKWDFGDGTTSTQQNPTHKYSKVGNYTVKLTATNAAGSNMVTKTDYIKVVTKPVAEFSASPTSGKAPLKVAFTDKSTGLPDKWKWSFGDGTTSREQNPEHQYLQEGKYKVVLTVSNAAGSNTVTKTNYITVTTNTRPGIYSENK